MLLHDWITNAHPAAFVKYEMRLGPTPLSVPGYPVTPQTEAMLRNANMYADAVVVDANFITIVEAKVVGQPAAVSQLKAYASLILTTPLLRQYANRQIVEMHLWAVDNALAHQMATQAGQAVTLYSPPWIQSYLENTYWKK